MCVDLQNRNTLVVVHQFLKVVLVRSRCASYFVIYTVLVYIPLNLLTHIQVIVMCVTRINDHVVNNITSFFGPSQSYAGELNPTWWLQWL